MSKTVFTKVDYDLGTLIKNIQLGEIGLPDIQRPFVWKNAKVRDLFDSMYRGYPVGYLLFWQNPVVDDGRAIGTDTKQKPSRLVIVDGQQRLTSLYAVIRGEPVLRDDFDSEMIEIAFNPVTETFEVADAAVRQDKAFIPNISVLWNDNTNIFEVVEEYLANLATSRPINDTERRGIQKAINQLYSLLTYPLTALELAEDIDEEAVSYIFVRINSKGTPLKQSDFILTLMSVFWDEGRAALELFCRAAKEPVRNTASPFNHFIEPSPDQLLRVGVAVAFKRARLKYVYSILRGKDLETRQFSDERRVAQFDLLKDAQGRVLNIQYWHDFLNCIRQAGFRSGKMITSNNNVIFAYTLYLIGRTEYRVDEFALRRMIARWFFMTAVTGRFTGSPESAMESDLARLRDVDTSDGFVDVLSRICDITLTPDFWSVTLPNDLATSSSRSPSLFAFNAAQVLLDAPALFSKQKVADLLDPSTSSNRASVERHHLFPKLYLATLGITDIKDTNQIANYSLVEWGDNAKIAATAPEKYLPVMAARFSNSVLERMYDLHALPQHWERLEYKEFLEVRRDLMAGVIERGYQTLLVGSERRTPGSESLDLDEILEIGESDGVEFKSTFRVNLHTGEKDPRMELAVLKTIAGFLNTAGGTLIVGLADDGSPVGIDADGFENEDKMSLHLVNVVKSRMGPLAMASIHARFDDHGESRVMVVKCQRSNSPVFVTDGSAERFYIRTGPSTSELLPSQTQEYIKQRFG